MSSVIKIPKDLADELDRLARTECKSRLAYAVDVLWRDVRRSQQREALQASAGAWRMAEHPAFGEGGAAYVDRIRAEPDAGNKMED